MCRIEVRARAGRASLARYGVLAALLAVAPMAAHADALIVVAGPMSGPGAKVTRTIRAAADHAAANLAEGLLDQRVVVEAVDDGCDEARAAIVAAEIVAKHPALVLGHPCTRAALAAAKVYGAAHVLYIASTVRHPELTDKRAGPTIFRTAGRDDRQGEAAAAYLAQFKDKRIVLVSDRTLFARTLVEQTRRGLTLAGAADVGSATIVAGEKEYRGLIAELKQKPPAAVFFAGFGIEAEIILTAMRAAGLAAPLLVPDAALSQDFSSILPGSQGGPLTPVCGLDGRALFGRTEQAIRSWQTAVVAAQSLAGQAVALRMAAPGLGFDKSGDLIAPSYSCVCWNGGNPSLATSP